MSKVSPYKIKNYVWYIEPIYKLYIKDENLEWCIKNLLTLGKLYNYKNKICSIETVHRHRYSHINRNYMFNHRVLAIKKLTEEYYRLKIDYALENFENNKNNNFKVYI